MTEQVAPWCNAGTPPSFKYWRLEEITTIFSFLISEINGVPESKAQGMPETQEHFSCNNEPEYGVVFFFLSCPGQSLTLSQKDFVLLRAYLYQHQE